MKRIFAFIITIMMLTSAYAAGQNTDLTFGNTSTPGASIGTLDTDRENYIAGITTTSFNVHFDVSGDNASRPKTQFSYSISTDGITNIAATTTQPAIYSGSNAATDAITFTSNVTDAWNTPNSEDDTDTIELIFDSTKFPHAGIYRFKIIQSDMTTEQTQLAIINGDSSGNNTNKELILDVYISYVNNALAVTGAVLIAIPNQPTLSDTEVDGTMNLASYANKIDGFYNSYTSYSVTLHKIVSGAAGDKNYFFPFNLTLNYNEPATDDANTTVGGVNVTLAATFNSTVGSAYVVGSGTANEYDDITIKDRGVVTITGLPLTTVLQLKETISAGEGYNITSAVTDMDNSAAITTAVNSETNYVTTGTVKAVNDMDMTYTNNRAAISPTGVILRYAPYMFMLVAGIVIFVVLKIRRKNI